ncbi:MAG TPA: hypothetical protein DD670_17235, partial [Planctomycetaceae bacterium]|nr:hypothetical protein [Planctomycetaceae bacterium]
NGPGYWWQTYDWDSFSVIENAPPTVTNVLVRGSTWDSSFTSYLATMSTRNVEGYSIPVGSEAQLAALLWGNVDQIKVVFSEDVVVDQGDLELDGVNVAEYICDDFAYDPGSFTATWTLVGTIGTDRLILRLNADGGSPIQDAAGNRLDGEWTNPPSTTPPPSNYPSGNGTAGGDFIFKFNVLPGDANYDGAVNAIDAAIMAANWGYNGAAWTPGDFNGNCTVDAEDAKILAANWGRSLPMPPAAAPAPEATNPELGADQADAALFVGPLQVGSMPATRQPIQPVQRLGGMGMQQRTQLGAQQRAFALRSPEELRIETPPEYSTAALDAALAEEYGPAQVGNELTTAIFNRHAAWSSMVARRQSNRRDAGDLGRAELAIDLLMAGRRG